MRRAHMTAKKKVVKKSESAMPSRRTLMRQLKAVQVALETSRSNWTEERLAVCLHAETIKDLRGLLVTRDEELRIAKVCIDDLTKALAGEQMESSRFRRIIDDQGQRIKLLEECLIDVSSLSDVATVVLTDMHGVAGMLEMLRAKALEMNFVFNPGPTAQNILLTCSTVSALGLLDAFFQKASEEAKVKK